MKQGTMDKDKKRLTMASVFSGIGGEMVAAAMMGWDVQFFCERNPFGHQVLSYWFNNAKGYEDITNTDFSEWRGRIDVLTGGFPCQPFSYAGKRKGADDDRYLWPYMFRAIDQIRPTWIVAENVAGITTMVEQGKVSPLGDEVDLFDPQGDIHRYQYEATFTLQRICQDLAQHGYSVQPVLIPACAVGAPHRRDRVFIVAHRDAPDSDRGTDGGEPGVVQGTKGSERVQERDNLRESGNAGEVRSEGAAVPENTLCSGLFHGQHEEQGSERDFGNARPGNSERVCGEAQRSASANTPCGGEGTSRQSERPIGDGCDENQQSSQRRAEPERTNGRSAFLRAAANTYGHRRTEVHQYVQSELSDGEESVSDGRQFNATYSESECSERARFEQPENGREKQEELRRRSGKSTDRNIAGCGRWYSFPTVSPVHRGNDGLPFSLDDLTLPPTKWRIESLKAYGNAIVPQVMYEIFRAIEEVEQQK